MKAAAYLRVSTVTQTERSQRQEIERWLEGHGIKARWYIDKETGDNLDRPEFRKMQEAIFNGTHDTVIVWKLDRLSRKLRDGINLLCEWIDNGVRVVSVTQQIDFAGPVGTIIASVLLGVAQMEQETRRERQAAGIAAAKAEGKSWGGWTPKHKRKVTPDKAQLIIHMKQEGKPVAVIARTLGLSRPTIYAVLKECKEITAQR